jgi:hypothetical protein
MVGVFKIPEEPANGSQRRIEHDAIDRRCFVVALTSCACGAVAAQAEAHVDESSEQAVALAYREDTGKENARTYPKHAVEQRCANCSCWQGKPDGRLGRLRNVRPQAHHQCRLVPGLDEGAWLSDRPIKKRGLDFSSPLLLTLELSDVCRALPRKLPRKRGVPLPAGHTA